MVLVGATRLCIAGYRNLSGDESPEDKTSPDDVRQVVKPGQPTQAQARQEAAPPAAPSADYAALIERAADAQDRQDWPAAADAMSLAIETAPPSIASNAAHMTDLYVYLGVYRSLAGQNAIAAIALEKAVELSPDNADALSRLGFAYQQSGRLREAEDAYRRALALAPGNDLARQGLAQCNAALASP